jgi:hypothetical protein
MKKSTIPILEFNYKFSTLSVKYEVEGKSGLAVGAQALALLGAFLSLFGLIGMLVPTQGT